jgi:hypothetical protein
MQSGAVDWSYRDSIGRTLLHVAARRLKPEWVKHILQQRPDLANVKTHVDRNPGAWTALQCAVETPRQPEGSTASADLQEVVSLLVKAMTPAAICSQTSKNSTVFHQVVARGHTGIVDIIAKAPDRKALADVLSVINNSAG